MNGLSLDDVVSALNGMVTKQAISKYERGLMNPSPSVLSALMEVYGVSSLDAHESVFNVTCWNFRKGKLLAAKLEEAIRNKILYMLERYLFLEDHLVSKIPFSSPFPKKYPVTMDNMEKAALDIRKRWRLGTDSITSVCRMLEVAGIKVIEFDMPEGVDGLSGWANRNIPFIALRKVEQTDRKRFTALHELAHILFPMLEQCMDYEKEKLCHRFASAMLFPEEAFYMHIGRKRTVFSLEELIALKESYGMSVSAMVYRAKDLGVITDVYYNHLFDDVINKNKKEEGWGAYLLKDEPRRYNELCFRGVAEGVLKEEQILQEFNLKLKFI